MKCFSRYSKTMLRVALLFLIELATLNSARADNLYARIHGTVTDSSGAVVPDVAVVAFNTGTGQVRTVTSDANGNFEFIQLPIGTYKVSASKNGFKKHERNGITLVLDQNYALPIQMEVGTTAETITVEANPVQVETTSNQLGAVVQGKTIVDMPLLGRNWIQLQQLQTGVVGTSDRFGDTFATNGSQAQQNSYLIDGIDDNDITLNDRLLIPSPDAIAEFNMVTNTINAEYGRNSGAILNAAIKSGTNSFHGDLFEFYRDT
ncbi:MAG TPA: carboxypeptidase-like regulatory domain-containing protein, partial [Terriglobales bacterium]|nr:carboxypeptidase-like regulatory domain-containing protein [Terriglobales bacterium]